MAAILLLGTYEGRIRDAFNIIREEYNDLDEGDKYYFSAVEHFQLKGLYLQATRGDSNATRYWHSSNPTALEHNAHMECHGMSEIEAMEEYVKLALNFEGGSFSENCQEALMGHPVLGDLGLEEEEDDEEAPPNFGINRKGKVLSIMSIMNLY